MIDIRRNGIHDTAVGYSNSRSNEKIKNTHKLRQEQNLQKRAAETRKNTLTE